MERVTKLCDEGQIMIINTMDHISDESEKITITHNDKFENVIGNYQEFIEALSAQSLNGSDDAGSESYGIGMLSENISNNNKLVTIKLANDIKFDLRATEKSYGRVFLSSNKEIDKFSTNDKALNTNKLNYFFESNIATNNNFGFVKMIPNNRLNGYIGNDVAVTIDNLSYAMEYMVPKMGIATTSNSGVVKIANIEEVREGKLGNGYVISPKKFHALSADENNYGISRISNDEEFGNFSSDNLSVSTKNLSKYKKIFSDMDNQINELSSDINNSSKNKTAYITIEVNKLLNNYGYGDIRNYVRVGNIVSSLRENAGMGVYEIPTGQYLNKNNYSELFSVIGYRYGGSGQNFRLPDLRGLFFRHRGIGTFIKNHWKYKSYGLQTPVYGNVQSQMVAKHRHGGDWNDQSKWGSSFGHSGNKGLFGSRAERYGCQAVYQTDGGVITSLGGIKDYPNPEGMIDSNDRETRPWTFVVNFYMRIK